MENVIYFASQDAFRAWLEENHDKAKAIQVGYYKVGTGKQGITYKESVDQALCFGWIDGVRYTVDSERYTNRFTPRKPRSIWSAVNIKRMGELIEMGMVHPAGLKAFETRDRSKHNSYSFEQREETLKFTSAQEQRLKTNKDAWAFWQKAPPSYTRAVIWWVVSAKQDATKEKRLTELIECSARGLKVPPMRRKTDKQG